MFTSLNVTIRTLCTKRLVRYMSHTQASRSSSSDVRAPAGVADRLVHLVGQVEPPLGLDDVGEHRTDVLVLLVELELDVGLVPLEVLGTHGAHTIGCAGGVTPARTVAAARAEDRIGAVEQVGGRAVRRYPVKSMLGEDLAAGEFDAGGLVGAGLRPRRRRVGQGREREAAEAVGPACSSWRRRPGTAAGGPVAVTFPDGAAVGVDDPHLAAPATFFGRACASSTGPRPGRRSTRSGCAT